MAAVKAEVCATCKWFWTAGDGDKTGQCHRYAPMPHDRTDRVKVWPMVDAKDGCGDYLKAK